MSRDELAKLECLAFVRGDFDARDYRSLVHHCRSGNNGHMRVVPPNSGEWYDVVAGPVAAVWRTRLSLGGCDQISFHTTAAAQLLDQSLVKIRKVVSP